MPPKGKKQQGSLGRAVIKSRFQGQRSIKLDEGKLVCAIPMGVYIKEIKPVLTVLQAYDRFRGTKMGQDAEYYARKRFGSLLDDSSFGWHRVHCR